MCSRSKSSRCLWSSLLTITVASCVSLLYFYVENFDKQSKNTIPSNGFPAKEMLSEEECIPVCDSKECVILASSTLKNMKPNVDPCENVNTFACGAYEEKFSIEENRFAFLDSYDKSIVKMNDILRNIEADPDTVPGKLKTMYDSCMNTAPMEKYALSTAEKFLRDVGIPDWPYLPPDFQFLGTDIPTIVGNMKGRGVLQFLGFKIPRAKPSYHSLNDSHNLTLRIDLRYFNRLFDFNKKSLAVDILKFFELDNQTIEDIWCDYSTVRKSVIKLGEENCNNLTETLMCYETRKNSKRIEGKSCGSQCNKFLWLDWLDQTCNEKELILSCSYHDNNTDDLCKFFEAFLNNSDLEEDYRINKEFIRLTEVKFLNNIFPVLKNFTDRAVANFLALNFYLSHLENLNFYFQRTDIKYFSPKRCDFFKPARTMDRWKGCTVWMMENMLFAAQYEFLNNYITLEENEKIISMFEECKSEVREAVDLQDWLRKKDKENINIEGIKFNFVELKKIQSRPLEYERTLNDYYKKFHPTGKNFLYDAMELRRTTSELLLQLSTIDLQLLRMKFDDGPYFEDSCSSVVYHFGFLTPPHYMPGLPRLINLLLQAVYMSHELGHGFDFSIDHTYRSMAYKRKGERELCINNQFSKFKYEFEDKYLNGQQFKGENVPDNIYAFILNKLIKKYVSAHEEILLPGLTYTFQQTAYILINELFCTRVSDDWEWFYRTGKSGHSPWKLRSIGPMQNSKGFSEAFSCPEGSYMNPSTKCAMLDDV